MRKADLNLGFVPRRKRRQGSAPYSCFRAEATVRSPRRPDVAHLAEDAKEPCCYWSGASVVTRLRQPCNSCDSACGATNDKCAFMMRFLRGLTFDLSGLPKAGPLEGRVRPRSVSRHLA